MANVKEKNVETLNNKEAFFMKYKKAIIIAVVALFVIVIGAILYNNYVKQPREAEASTALAKGQEYFAAQQFDKAVANLKKAAKMADAQGADGVNNSLSPTFLIQAAEILESQNKKAEALSIYKDIKKKYVNSPVMQEIDKYIERVTE